MNCNDKEAAKKLADYFSGHLNGAEKKRVKNHLSQCLECRTSLKVMSLLAGRHGNPSSTDSGEHLTTELLTVYFEDKKALDEKTVRAIESHLKSCERCSYDLNFLISTEKELENSIAPVTGQKATVTRFLDNLAMLIRKPAFAYLLLFLAIYPATMWLLRQDQGPGSDMADYLPNHEFVLVEQRRSSGEVPVLYRTENKSLIAVAVPYHHLKKEFFYRIFFSQEDSLSPLELETITDFSEPDLIRVIFQTRPIPDGIYTLVISEIDLKNRSDSLRSRYLFQVKTSQ